MNYFIYIYIPLYRNRVSITTREIKAISIIRGQLLGQIYASDVFSRFGGPAIKWDMMTVELYDPVVCLIPTSEGERDWGYFEEMVVIISYFADIDYSRPKMTATYLYLTFNI